MELDLGQSEVFVIEDLMMEFALLLAAANLKVTACLDYDLFVELGIFEEFVADQNYCYQFVVAHLIACLHQF